MRLIDNETSITMNKRRNFVNYATMTLSNGTVLNLTPADFRIAGNTYTDDWVDGNAFQLGTAIGKTATILLDNTDGRTETIGSSEVVYPHGKFSQYDFYMAYFTLEVRLPEAHHVGGVLVDKSFVIGTFTVTQPVAHGATIEITGVDNMYMFDKSFDDCTLDFSSNPTLQTILNRCCDDCGVAKGSTTQNFNNRTLTVSEKPENTTYRQVVSWIAQIAGCNAVIGIMGALELKWYDMSEFANDLDGGTFLTTTTPYSDGDVADGGSFSPWNTGYEADGGDFTTPLHYHNLTATTGTEISTDDIQFTGVQIINGDTSINYPSTTGWDYYAMIIEDNPFVTGNESTIAQYIYGRLVGLKFRPFSCSSIQDPTIEAGDCALVYDVKGNTYYSIITNVNFKTGGMTEISCKAESPARQGNRFVNQAAYEAARALSKAEQYQDDYNTQVAHFNALASQALGYYRTDEVDSTGAMITYIHDDSTLGTSTIIWKITSAGVFISEDGGQSYNTGVDMSTGTMLMNLVYTHGITADWIQAGTMTLGGYDNIDGILEVYNHYSLDTGNGVNNVWTDFVNVNYSTVGNVAGDYILYAVVAGVSPATDKNVRYALYKSTNGGTYTLEKTGYLIAGTHNKIDYVCNVTPTNTDVYRIRLILDEATISTTYRWNIYCVRKNTTINKNGITTSNIVITGGNITLGYNYTYQRYNFTVTEAGGIHLGLAPSGQTSPSYVYNFIVDNDGNMTARSGYIGNGSQGWKIQPTYIQNNNGPTAVDNVAKRGTYIGVDGILNTYGGSSNQKYVKIADGAITANSGNIAGFTIDNDGFQKIGSNHDVADVKPNLMRVTKFIQSDGIKVSMAMDADNQRIVINSDSGNGNFIVSNAPGWDSSGNLVNPESANNYTKITCSGITMKSSGTAYTIGAGIMKMLSQSQTVGDISQLRIDVDPSGQLIVFRNVVAGTQYSLPLT